MEVESEILAFFVFEYLGKISLCGPEWHLPISKGHVIWLIKNLKDSLTVLIQSRLIEQLHENWHDVFAHY